MSLILKLSINLTVAQIKKQQGRIKIEEKIQPKFVKF